MPSAVPHEQALKAKYDFSYVAIRSSNHISQRASFIISKFTAAKTADSDPKAAVVALQASARAVNKLISVVEIAKRELKAQQIPTFQYTALTSEAVEFQRKVNTLVDEERKEGGKDESDDAFEKIETLAEQRLSPVLTIYLASTAVKELRTAYGYGRRERLIGSMLTCRQRTA